MNNLGWLRRLDAESLADRLRGNCHMCARINDSCGAYAPCVDGIMEWLLQEHEEPDSWEKIEADARSHPTNYWGCKGFLCRECPSKIEGSVPFKHYNMSSCIDAVRVDLVRRCKALAEKEAGR